ncbi:MAG: hypothetical protein WKF92_09295 [Pyrinomonadaceae bacterium]
MDPKGRFVYFANSTAFDYNKNVYDSIYWIERYDMSKARRSNFVRGSGGAARPARCRRTGNIYPLSAASA